MAITYATQIDRIHYLLNQLPTATSNRVTDAMIIEFLKEAQEVVCLIGKVWEVVKVSQSSITTGIIPFSTIEAWTGSSPVASTWSSGTHKLIEILDVANPTTGVSYNFMPYTARGKMFQTATSGDTMWWSTVADILFLTPTPNNLVAVYGYGLDQTTVADGDTSPALPDEYHYQMINYAAFRGKQAYNQNQEAMGYLSAFAQGVGLNLDELKAKVGAR